jgi:phosphoribosylglycinamide formyltransferase-1
MFPGTHAIQRAYAACQNGEITHSGVMVHLVPDEGVDTGPVLATWKVYFRPDETLAEFETRIHSAEHFLLVQALKQQIISKNNG